MAEHDRKEWLEPDGLGGFASGSATGIRTRRYHALLLAAATPPTGRVVLVNWFDAWMETPAGRYALSAQRYEPDVVYPDGLSRLSSFACEPWPTWQFTLEDGTRVRQEVIGRHGATQVAVLWEISTAGGPCTLEVRPFLSGRDYHSLHHENPAFRFEPERTGQCLIWRPYDGLPAIEVRHDGQYFHQPDWYRRFLYAEEAARGLDCTEDLAAPGVIRWRFDGPGLHRAVMVLSAGAAEHNADDDAAVRRLAACIRDGESARRAAFPTRLHRAADGYLVSRGAGKTIVAGYPWFTDWGRDTFIALRGLCLATGRLDDARSILLEWAHAVSDGMLPNRFPDGPAEPEFNSVDASLWYVIAVGDFLSAVASRGVPLHAADRDALAGAVTAIVDGYAAGTRFGIRADTDGLLAAGVDGVQLTWMDAKIGGWVVTPRIGKPVEVQALWLNALWLTQQDSPARRDLLTRGLESFRRRFWNEQSGCLYDVVDVNHEPGTVDASLRPNQVLALGGLPLALVERPRARQALDTVEAHLWTPMGLRSLAPGADGYAPRYEGGPSARDAVYHQGTVWPWLIGPFVEAWVRARNGSDAAKADARTRFLEPLLAHLNDGGLGHVSEIADAEAPHVTRGCPFQAWSTGELLRLDAQVLAATAPRA